MHHIAQQAAHRQRVAGFLPLTEAQFQFQNTAIGRVMPQRRAVNRLAIQRPAEERSRLGTASGSENFLKGIQSKERGIVKAETALPNGIGIQKPSRRAERRNHLAGVLKQVAIPLLGLALRLFLVEGCSLVQGYGHKAGERAETVAQGGDVERDREKGAILAAQHRIEAGHHAGRQRLNAEKIGLHAGCGSGFRRSFGVAELFHLRNQARSLPGSQYLGRTPLVHQFGGIAAQHAFGGGIHISEPAIQIDGHDAGTGRVQQVLQRFGAWRGYGFGNRGDVDQQTKDKEYGGCNHREYQQAVKPGTGGKAGDRRARGNGQRQDRKDRPECGKTAQCRRRG